MSDLKIVTDPSVPEPVEAPRSAVPVLASEATLTRRDLDMIKRDLITVRKDYCEIRDNMVVLTHQYSRAPSKSFFVTFGFMWLFLLATLLIFQPQLSALATKFVALMLHR